MQFWGSETSSWELGTPSVPRNTYWPDTPALPTPTFLKSYFFFTDARLYESIFYHQGPFTCPFSMEASMASGRKHSPSSNPIILYWHLWWGGYQQLGLRVKHWCPHSSSNTYYLGDIQSLSFLICRNENNSHSSLWRLLSVLNELMHIKHFT